MKVSKTWLKELVNLKIPIGEVERLLPLRSIAIKEFAKNYFELDMKGYNRADLLSMRGIAYEIAAITSSEITFSEIEEKDFVWTNTPLPKIQVEVEDSKAAPLYCLAKIEGLKTDKSPVDWVKKLEDSGMRSVNNLADVTNLVMWEYGQPLHAFDAKAVKDETIIVRCANDQEKLITLDSKERLLLASDLLITDPKKSLGLAGVMGGKNSEVADFTTTILLEAAIFDPVILKQTTQRLGLASEASKRFEHGLTKKRLFQALDAAIRYYQKLGGKLTALTIVGDFEDKITTLKLTQNKVNSLIGINIPADLIEEYLIKLSFLLSPVPAPVFDSGVAHGSIATHHDLSEIEGQTRGGLAWREGEKGEWEVAVPYWRLDINTEEDLVEEVARMYGYEKIPAQPLQGKLPTEVDQKLFHLIYDLKVELVKIGLTEVQSYSFYSTQILNNLVLNLDNLVKVANPMSKETEYMRNLLWPNILEVAANNLKTRGDLAIFEIGKVYNPVAKSLPDEKYKLSLALSNNADNPILELYQILNKLSQNMNLNLMVEEDAKSDDTDLSFLRENTPTARSWVDSFHPMRQAVIRRNNDGIGFIAEVHPRIVNRFGREEKIAVLEMDFKKLL